MTTPRNVEPGDHPETDDDLEPEAELVALRLAAGQSHAEAALAIGRSAKWVQRRLVTDPRLRLRVLALRSARVEEAAAGLSNLLDRAVAAVASALDSDRPADQLRAAKLVFDGSRVFRGDADQVAQLRELRGQVAELQQMIDVRDRSRK